MDSTITREFRNNLPSKPYCYNTGTSVIIRNQEHAITKDFIQYNNLNNAKFLFFDCNIAEVQDQFGTTIPEPNLLLINSNKIGDDGVYYALENGVHLNKESREHPKSYLKAVINTLALNLNTNPTEVNFIGKNPLKNDLWHTIESNSNLITLGDLAKFQLLPYLPKIANQIGFNRNQYCYDVLRKEAYKKVFDYKITSTIDDFFSDMLKVCQLINKQQFKSNPLHHSELYDITRNVIEWTWYKYTGKLPKQKWQAHIKATHTSEIQARRGTKGGLASGVSRALANEEKRNEARSMALKGMTQKAISVALGVGQGTVSKWLKN